MWSYCGILRCQVYAADIPNDAKESFPRTAFILKAHHAARTTSGEQASAFREGMQTRMHFQETANHIWC